MTRSRWKVPFRDYEISHSFIHPESTSSNRPLTIVSRRSTIPLSMSGAFVKVYNGTLFVTRRVTKVMVGHKFGEFSPTRKPHIFKKKGKKGKMKKK